MAAISVFVTEGDKYGFLTVIREVERKGKYRRVLCSCECGKETIIYLVSLRRNPKASCGCVRTEEDKKRLTKHGLSRHPLYEIWNGIKRRLKNNPKLKCYHSYYGAGVKMCDEWRNDFLSFYNWAIANGWKKGLQIDKDKLAPTKPGKLYSPEFCSILTARENQNYTVKNVKYPFEGEMLHLDDISRRTGLSQALLFKRINYDKRTLEEAFKVEDRRGLQSNARKLTDEQIIEIYKSSLPVKELSLMYGMSQGPIFRIKRKKSWKHLLKDL